jgi:hypothetical protein
MKVVAMTNEDLARFWLQDSQKAKVFKNLATF